MSANEGGSGMMLGNSSNGFQLVYPDGSKDVFGLEVGRTDSFELSGHIFGIFD